MQRAMGECVERGLDELANARNADDGAVNAAKSGEAKDFGGVVAVWYVTLAMGAWVKLLND